MKYYKVKPEADNKRQKNGDIYIANELYTVKEVEKLSLNKSFLQLVEIPKSKIYFCFGARFADWGGTTQWNVM